MIFYSSTGSKVMKNWETYIQFVSKWCKLKKCTKGNYSSLGNLCESLTPLVSSDRQAVTGLALIRRIHKSLCANSVWQIMEFLSRISRFLTYCRYFIWKTLLIYADNLQTFLLDDHRCMYVCMYVCKLKKL